MRRRRWRTAVLWAGCTLCVLIVAAFVVSAWWIVAAQAGGVGVDVASGSIGIGLGDSSPPSPGAIRHPSGLQGWNSWAFGPRWVGFPLYAVFLAVAVPTLLVWRIVPRFPKGHCLNCGYDLTGNVSGTCPECGREAVSEMGK